MSGRTSTLPILAKGTWAAISSARSLALDVDDVEAADVLLGLDVGPSDTTGTPSTSVHGLRQVLVADPVGAHELTESRSAALRALVSSIVRAKSSSAKDSQSSWLP